MVAEIAEKKLYDAATKGDLATFQTLLQQDLFLVDQVSFSRSRNLLHIATIHGQVGIVEELLRINFDLARDVDSKKWASLHIAAAQGHVEIARKLSSVAPEICWRVDDQGMNPVHIAAMRGHVEILEVLLQHDLSPAMERLHRGQTVLHLCVKHHQVETLRFLGEKMGDLVRAKDDDGETLLHLAVRCDRVEMVRYLLEKNKIQKLTENSMGKTPLDILRESSQHTAAYSDIEEFLLRYSDKPLLNAFRGITGMTMVVVVLIAGMAFQAAVSPPGGVWEDDTSSHRAGKAVVASTHPKLYKHFARANTTAFVSSLVVLLLVIIRVPIKSCVLMTVICYATVVSMAAIGVSYGASLIMIDPDETQTVGKIVAVVVSAYVGVHVFISVCIYVPEMYVTWKRVKQQHGDLTIARRIRRCCYQFLRNFERMPVN